MMFMKTDTVNGQAFLGMQFNERVAVYDAHSGGYGLQQWPASSTPTSPSGWEYIDYQSNANPNPDPLPVPESLNIGLIMVLSVVAVAAGAVILNKRSRLSNFTARPKSAVK